MQRISSKTQHHTHSILPIFLPFSKCFPLQKKKVKKKISFLKNPEASYHSEEKYAKTAPITQESSSQQSSRSASLIKHLSNINQMFKRTFGENSPTSSFTDNIISKTDEYLSMPLEHLHEEINSLKNNILHHIGTEYSLPENLDFQNIEKTLEDYLFLQLKNPSHTSSEHEISPHIEYKDQAKIFLKNFKERNKCSISSKIKKDFYALHSDCKNLLFTQTILNLKHIFPDIKNETDIAKIIAGGVLFLDDFKQKNPNHSITQEDTQENITLKIAAFLKNNPDEALLYYVEKISHIQAIWLHPKETVIIDADTINEIKKLDIKLNLTVKLSPSRLIQMQKAFPTAKDESDTAQPNTASFRGSLSFRNLPLENIQDTSEQPDIQNTSEQPDIAENITFPTLETQSILTKIREYKEQVFLNNDAPENIVHTILNNKSIKNILLSLYKQQNPNIALSDKDIVTDVIHHPENHSEINLKLHALISLKQQLESLQKKEPKRLKNIQKFITDPNNKKNKFSDKNMEIYSRLLITSEDVGMSSHLFDEILQSPEKLLDYIKTETDTEQAEASYQSIKTLPHSEIVPINAPEPIVQKEETPPSTSQSDNHDTDTVHITLGSQLFGIPHDSSDTQNTSPLEKFISQHSFNLKIVKQKTKHLFKKSLSFNDIIQGSLSYPSPDQDIPSSINATSYTTAPTKDLSPDSTEIFVVSKTSPSNEHDLKTETSFIPPISQHNEEQFSTTDFAPPIERTTLKDLFALSDNEKDLSALSDTESELPIKKKSHKTLDKLFSLLQCIKRPKTDDDEFSLETLYAMNQSQKISGYNDESYSHDDTEKQYSIKEYTYAPSIINENNNSNMKDGMNKIFETIPTEFQEKITALHQSSSSDMLAKNVANIFEWLLSKKSPLYEQIENHVPTTYYHFGVNIFQDKELKQVLTECIKANKNAFTQQNIEKMSEILKDDKTTEKFLLSLSVPVAMKNNDIKIPIATMLLEGDKRPQGILHTGNNTQGHVVLDILKDLSKGKHILED